MNVWQALGAGVDFSHALFMVLWIAGLPLLFYRKKPRLTRLYAMYAISFVVSYQISRVFLGECFLTTISRAFWQRAPQDVMGGASDEWFTVRLAQAVFHMTPSHKAITSIAQVLVFVTAAGALYSYEVQKLRKKANA